MCPLESEQDTYNTLSSALKWSDRKGELGAGRCTVSRAVRPRKGGLGFGFTSVFPSIPWNPQSSTEETANLLVLGWELRLPDLLTGSPTPREHQALHKYTQVLIERL